MPRESNARAHSAAHRCDSAGRLTIAAAVVGADRPTGHGSRAAFVGLVVGGYAGVLAVEFALLRRSYADGRPDAAERGAAARAGSPRSSRRRGLSLAPAVSFAREPDHLPRDGARPARRAPRPRLLLQSGLCGIRGCGGCAQHDVPFIAVSLEPVFGSIDDYRADDRCRRRERLEQRDRPGAGDRRAQHGRSGGASLAGRRRPMHRWHRLVTIASPHAGTRLGGTRRGANIGQMRHRQRLARAAGARASRRSARALHLLLEPLRQHRLPDAQRDARGRRQPSSGRDAARADGLSPGGVREVLARRATTDPRGSTRLPSHRASATVDARQPSYSASISVTSRAPPPATD